MLTIVSFLFVAAIPVVGSSDLTTADLEAVEKTAIEAGVRPFAVEVLDLDFLGRALLLYERPATGDADVCGGTVHALERSDKGEWVIQALPPPVLRYITTDPQCPGKPATRVLVTKLENEDVSGIIEAIRSWRTSTDLAGRPSVDKTAAKYQIAAIGPSTTVAASPGIEANANVYLVPAPGKEGVVVSLMRVKGIWYLTSAREE